MSARETMATEALAGVIIAACAEQTGDTRRGFVFGIIQGVERDAREQGRAEGRREALLEAASAAHQFQDIVGWQPGESRNRLVGDIEAAIRKLIEAENGGGA